MVEMSETKSHNRAICLAQSASNLLVHTTIQLKSQEMPRVRTIQKSSSDLLNHPIVCMGSMCLCFDMGLH